MPVLPDAGFGLYVHWPFCMAKCPYCDFNSHVWEKVDQSRWAAALAREVERVASQTPDRVLRSVFFGGGTPSLMSGETVKTIMDAVRASWRFENDIEITLEANPTSVEAERFADYRSAGVNRISIGVQALNDPDLKALGRLHSVDEALDAIDVARSTFDRVSFDLIYARQNQAVRAWEDELNTALALKPDHLSLYQLTIEDGTAFGDRFKRGRLAGLPSEDLGADLWEVTQSLCNSAGLPAYEVSNHAKKGSESRHNLIYWTAGDYGAVGPGAHGRITLDGHRTATEAEKNPAKWLDMVEQGGAGDIVAERLAPDEVLTERLLMGLRVRDGILMPENWILNKNNKINGLKELGLLSCLDGRLTATEAGAPILNSILSELLAD